MRRFRSDAGLICRIATLRRRDRFKIIMIRFALGRFLGFEQRENRLKLRGLLLLFFS
jgi:hypothetical protein